MQMLFVAFRFSLLSSFLIVVNPILMYSDSAEKIVEHLLEIHLIGVVLVHFDRSEIHLCHRFHGHLSAIGFGYLESFASAYSDSKILPCLIDFTAVESFAAIINFLRLILDHVLGPYLIVDLGADSTNFGAIVGSNFAC